MKVGNCVGVVSISTRLRIGHTGIRIPAGARCFYILENAQTGSEAQKATCSTGTGSSFTERKVAGG